MYYIKNLQDDIIGIIDSAYDIKVRYEYDSWGSIVFIKDEFGNDISNETHIGIINPFRYRSYYYDEETKLYYLNSRYYNPLWGRFLNSDGVGGANKDISSQNLYAYVSNSPINNYDPSGKFLKKLLQKFVNFVSSVFDYSINKSTSKKSNGFMSKPSNPIKSTATPTQKAVNNKIINTVANSKITCNIGIGTNIGFANGGISYGETIAPNYKINTNHVTVSGGFGLGKSFPIYPIVSFNFQLNYKGEIFKNNSALTPYASFGVGINYNTSDIYGITISPGYGTDVGWQYTWEWDRK